MIDRPDWSNTFDSRGNEIVPVEAPKEHQALVAEIANSDGPSTGDDSPVVPAVPAKKNISGLPDWDKPRNEAGQFVSKSEAEYRAIWAKEGGADAAIAKVLSVEATILSASPDATALQAHVATLPKDIQLKAADAMRLQTSYGPSGGALKWEQFVNSLSPSQSTAFETWWRGLSRSDQDNILGVISK